MLEIIMALAILLGLAKRKGRRKFRRYLRGNILFELSLGTLAGDTLLGALVTDTVNEKAWLTSVRATWTLRNYTVAAGDGPITVGIAHSDYTDAEVQAWMTSANSWEQGDKIAQEVARRKCKQVGTFALPIAEGLSGDISLNDGKPITTKCNWQLISGQTVRLWAFNGAAGSLTDLSNLHVNGHANLWPN